MSLLRNPWVTGLLAVTAVAVVGYQSLGPAWRRGITARAVTVLAPFAGKSQPEPTVAPAPPISALSVEPPSVPIDMQYAESRLSEWAESPRRDPFLVIPVAPGKAVMQLPSPVMHWKLKAIWRQTGGRVAAINNRVVTEGDSIEGFKVQTIEGDQVWFLGPNGLERLGFDKGQEEASNAKEQPNSKTQTPIAKEDPLNAEKLSAAGQEAHAE